MKTGLVMGSFWGDFAPLFFVWVGQLGSLLDQLGIILGLFWCHFSPHLRVILGPILPILGSFLGVVSGVFGCVTVICSSLVIFLGTFNAKTSKSMQDHATHASLYHKFSRNKNETLYSNYAKTSRFPPFKHLFCLETQSKSTLQL